jgi:methylmalonyl-CoA mutase
MKLKTPVLGITGTGGDLGKIVVDELVRFLIDFPENIGLISVDPSKRKTGGALLRNRIRMNAINPVYAFISYASIEFGFI